MGVSGSDVPGIATVEAPRKRPVLSPATEAELEFLEVAASALILRQDPREEESTRPTTTTITTYLLSQISWGRLEIKSTDNKNKKHKKGTS
jgi:hypothetical protein